MAGAYFSTPTVIDMTALAGSWDFELKWTPRALLAQAGTEGITISDALDKQLGLKLEAQQVAAAAILVDSVAMTPAENPADVATRLPKPPAPEFEVAEIKLSPADAQVPRAQLLPTGQINASGVPLNLMIGLAWSLPNERFIAGPKWLETTRYELIARAFSAPVTNAQVDEDILRLMLRALIVDRFQMKYHMEDRPMDGFSLTAVKPKMAKSDPATRSRCFEGPPPNSPDPRNRTPILSRLITCQNVTMTQFAQLLPGLAGGYLQTAAVDRTALAGSWDFSLNFSPAGVFQQATGRGGEPGAANAAADPNGALSLFEALDRQLGLKLEQQKRPLPVLVIDSISEKPSDN
jgi:uncharacterized protein (TIGR03435 family)